MDGSGTRVVEYTYDAWGKLISTSGTLASTLGADNPFRYRGYYYDAETGLYYLMTRYYDPEVGRFLSADVYLSTGQGVLGGNMWAYCRNNPIIRKDVEGREDTPNESEIVPPWLIEYCASLDTLYRTGYKVLAIKHEGTREYYITEGQAATMTLSAQSLQIIGGALFVGLGGKMIGEIADGIIAKMVTKIISNPNVIRSVKYVAGAISRAVSLSVYDIDDGAYITETYAVTANYNGGTYQDTIQRTTRVGGGSGNLLTGIHRTSGYIVTRRSRGLGENIGSGIKVSIGGRKR